MPAATNSRPLALAACLCALWAIPGTALAGKEREDFRLLIVGRGSKGRYQRLARGLGCEQQLVFPGPADDVRPM